MTETVLVTGGAGFIGRSVAAALTNAGYSVRAGVRSLPGPALANIASVPCDLDSPDQVAEAVTGASAVVHCAYGDEDAMTRQCAVLLAAMSGAGVERLVYFSSIAVYGDATDPRIIDPIDMDRLSGPYARGKADCERLVRDWVSESFTRRAIILRPGIVYGKGSPFWVEKLSQRIRAGVWADFGPAGGGFAPLVHVDDVAYAASKAVRRLPDLSGAVPAIDLVGPETLTWNDYSQRVAQAIGMGPLPRIGQAKLAWWQVRAIPAKVFNRLGVPGFKRAALAPTGGELKNMARRAVYDRARAQAVLGAAPSIALDEGVRRTFG
jgi:nucleoside-diphosphate-sugar epimerase